jgi:hypothetical protein
MIAPGKTEDESRAREPTDPDLGPPDAFRSWYANKGWPGYASGGPSGETWSNARLMGLCGLLTIGLWTLIARLRPPGNPNAWYFGAFVLGVLLGSAVEAALAERAERRKFPDPASP